MMLLQTYLTETDLLHKLGLGLAVFSQHVPFRLGLGGGLPGGFLGCALGLLNATADGGTVVQDRLGTVAQRPGGHHGDFLLSTVRGQL